MVLLLVPCSRVLGYHSVKRAQMQAGGVHISQPTSIKSRALLTQIIESTTDGAMLRAHTRANNCLFSAPKGQGNVTSQGPKIIARSFSMVTKENTLRVNCTSPLDLLTDGLLIMFIG